MTFQSQWKIFGRGYLLLTILVSYFIISVLFRIFSGYASFCIAKMKHCYLYGLSNCSGNFSDDGIEQVGRNGSYIQCTSAHLTSFAVLVDVSGEGQDETVSID